MHCRHIQIHIKNVWGWTLHSRRCTLWSHETCRWQAGLSGFVKSKPWHTRGMYCETPPLCDPRKNIVQNLYALGTCQKVKVKSQGLPLSAKAWICNTPSWFVPHNGSAMWKMQADKRALKWMWKSERDWWETIALHCHKRRFRSLLREKSGRILHTTWIFGSIRFPHLHQKLMFIEFRWIQNSQRTVSKWPVKIGVQTWKPELSFVCVHHCTLSIAELEFCLHCARYVVNFEERLVLFHR